MRVLVLGGTGSIGAPVLRGLVARSHDVIALARSESSAAKIIGFGATPLRGDIGTPEQWIGKLPPLDAVVQLACDFAAKGCARLTHSEVPSTPDTEKSFDELKQRIARTVDYVKAFKPAQFEGADRTDVTFPAGPNNSITLKGQEFVNRFSFPNFYFHAATTHGILRHNGVEIGKRDFLGIA